MIIYNKLYIKIISNKLDIAKEDVGIMIINIEYEIKLFSLYIY